MFPFYIEVELKSEAMMEADYESKHMLNLDKWIRDKSYLMQIATLIIFYTAIQPKNVILFSKKDMPGDNIISSLVKVCSNPYCRTMSGFCEMVLIEWTHFSIQAQRVSTTTQYKERLSLPFLLFLDCLYQIMLVYPQCFEFNLKALSFFASAHLTDMYKEFCVDVARANQSILQHVSELKLTAFRNDLYSPNELKHIILPFFKPDQVEVADFLLHNKSLSCAHNSNIFPLMKHYSYANSREVNDIKEAEVVFEIQSLASKIGTRVQFQNASESSQLIHTFSDSLLNPFEQNFCMACDEPITLDFCPGTTCESCRLQVHLK